MIKFNISAPGTIILSGDHAMVNKKKNVLMASLDRRTTLKFCELRDEQEIVKIEFPNIDLSLNVPLEKVQNFSLIDRQDKKDMFAKIVRLHRYVKHLITVNGMWSTHEQRISLQTLFLLLFYIARNEKLEIRSFHVCVSTELPISGGLGSSSSFAVCLAACFIHWARLQKGAHDEFDENDLKKIFKATQYFEFYTEDYVSSFDTYVCTYGKIHNFKYINFENVNHSSINMPVTKILLIDAKLCRNNRERLQRMAELKHNRPETADQILCRFDEITQKIHHTIYKIAEIHINPNSLQEAPYAQLEEHIQENQQILYSNGLSHSRLDDIYFIAGCLGFEAKLTGFGGRFAYILLPPSIPEERITNLRTKLKTLRDFRVTTTSVSCSGVRIDD